jgi:hypothetical protein
LKLGFWRLGREQDGVDGRLILEGDLGPPAPGTMKTPWKQATGNNSAWRSASHSARACPWHFGQCRLRQVMGAAHYLLYGQIQ